MKYELTDETINIDNRVLYRIRALKDFAYIKKGTLGGFIEKVDNLSQNGACWVHNEAKVFENAKICEDAQVYGNARIDGNSKISGDTKICGYMHISDKILVTGLYNL